MNVMHTVDDRLEAALSTGGREAIAAWASTGLAGLLRLREYLAGTLDFGALDGINQRDVIDNTAAAVVPIAAASPVEFIDVFDDARFAANSFVLDGLGQIDDPRATDRLARASTATDWGVRMHAAIGLGRRQAALATDVLGRLLADDDDLVRFHAVRSLARIGDASALPGLRRLLPKSNHEAELIDQAIASIAGRATDRGASD